MFPSPLLHEAEQLLALLRSRRLMLVTAESCTGGLIAGLLTEIPGSSNVFERGFVTYSNASKIELLGVPAKTLDEFGAVSRETAIAMVTGGLARTPADICVAVTGIAGPGGGSAEKPAGLVHLAALRRGGSPLHEQVRFGDMGRQQVRLESVARALALVGAVL